MIENIKQKSAHPIALPLSIDIKKTSEVLAKIHKISGDTMLRRLGNNCISRKELISLAIKYFGTTDLPQ